MRVFKFSDKRNFTKKHLIIVASILGLFAVIGISFATYTVESEEYVVVNSSVGEFTLADIKIIVLVDGVKQDSFPTKGSGYVFESLTCENGSTGTWDSEDWELNMAVKGPDKCTVSFVTATLATVCVNQNAADCIYENGMVYSSHEMNNDDLDGNVRYMGANPNNYVTFNGESWRIIGVFNVASSANGTTQQRVKLIRTDGIGEYSWDSSASGVNGGDGVNEWSQADIMTTLNSGAYWNRASGTCYSDSEDATTACDFSSTGLTAEAKALISDAYWNLGTTINVYPPTLVDTVSQMYEFERSTNTGKICGVSGASGGTSCNDTVARTTGWVGKVGLMYLSDYGYATSGGSTTNRATCLSTALGSWNGSSVSDCKNNSWLFSSSINQWTLTPVSANYYAYYVLYVHKNGHATGTSAGSARLVRPVVYLSTDVKITGGDGTSGNPYTLAI